MYILDIEKMIAKHLKDEPTDYPWCWITQKGKILYVDYMHHASRLHELFTDDINPELAPYVIKTSNNDTNYEAYFENNWVKITRGMITIPPNLSVKQRLTVEKVVLINKNLFFSDKENWFSLCRVGEDISTAKGKYHTIILENNRIKWEKF